MHVPIPEARISLADIAAAVGGALINAPAAGFAVGLCPLDFPLEGCVTFSRDGNVAKLLKALRGCRVAAVLVPEGPSEEIPAGCPALIVAKDPLSGMTSLVSLFFREPPLVPGRSPLSLVASSASIAPDASIGEFCSIGEGAVIESGVVLMPRVTIYPFARVGARSVLHSGVSLRESCIVGTDCILHNGVVIGADGFGYVPDPRVGLKKVPQVGAVRVGNHVEIGANSCVDRATFGITDVGDGTKIDNLTQIGHNVRIGKSSIICGQVGIAGSCSIGNGVVIGAQSGVADHCTVPDRVRLAARSGVTSDLEAGDYGGFPAVPASDWRRQLAGVARLPGVLRKLRRILRGSADKP